MPKDFDKSTLGFTTGVKGSNAYPSDLEYVVEGNKIIGTLKSTLKAGEGLTIRLTLPDGYFVGASLNFDIYTICVIAFCIISILITFLIWQKYGKNEEVIETVEFYPPEGLNSAEVGFLYKGNADIKSIISLLIYLANKGYIKIEETDQKRLFSKSKVVKIIKLKEYDGDNECEKIFFNGLFDKLRPKGTLIKASKIQRSEQRKWNKISWKDAKKRAEIEAKIEESKDYVTFRDLYFEFCRTIGIIGFRFNNKYNKEQILEPMSLGKCIYFIFIIIAIFILITVKPVNELYGGITVPLTLLLSGISYTVLFNMIDEKNSIIAIIFKLVCLGFIGKFWVNNLFSSLTYYPIYLITYIIGIVCIIVLVFFIKIMRKRTPYGNKMYGKIKGFKRFLETAEKEQLEDLVEQNPEYFYNILPYTYALGVSKKWMKQFETIALKGPGWYSSSTEFNVRTFNNFINSTMRSATNAMTSGNSSGSSSTSGDSSGGASSGGGVSGGGSGRRRWRFMVKTSFTNELSIS